MTTTATPTRIPHLALRGVAIATIVGIASGALATSASAATERYPMGSIHTLGRNTATTALVTGRAADPDRPTLPVLVEVTVSGQHVATTSAKNGADGHDFAVSVPVDGQTRQVCITAIGRGPSKLRRQLDCNYLLAVAPKPAPAATPTPAPTPAPAPATTPTTAKPAPKPAAPPTTAKPTPKPTTTAKPTPKPKPTPSPSPSEGPVPPLTFDTGPDQSVGDDVNSREVRTAGQTRWSACHTGVKSKGGGAKIDWCWEKVKWVNDGDPKNDYYLFTVYGTAMDAADEPGFWKRVHGAVFDVKPRDAAGLSWFKWSPGGDRNGDCSSVSIAVAAGPVSVGRDLTACETWDVTKRATAGSLRVEWKGPRKGTSADRELALAIGVKVKQGAPVPRFNTDVTVKGICSALTSTPVGSTINYFGC